jgi:hypothetical protein
MPLQKIQFRPGINREGTNYSNEGGWFDCDKVRFRSGYPEKIGGWNQATPGYTYQGVCRSMINWIDLQNNNLIGLGTNLKYYINRSTYYDITPLIHTSSGLSNPFSTTSGSQIVTVTDAGYSPSVGQFVNFTGASAFNGLAAGSLNTEFAVTNVIDATHYQITLPAGVTPTGTGSGGGTVTAAYQIPIGLPAYTTGNGFGAGPWNGVNTSATAYTNLAYTSGVTPWDLLNATSTTINVSSTTGFPSTGTIIIDAELITYSGTTSTSFTGCVRGAPYIDPNGTYAASTTATSVGASDTSIQLASVSGFIIPLTGGYATIKIGSEFITYSGITSSSNTLTGCVRGAFGTTAATHGSGATVNQYSSSYATYHGIRPTSGSSIYPVVYDVTGYIGGTGWGQSTPGAGSGIGEQMRVWTNDNYGQDLIIAPRGGPIYYWTNNTSTFPRAVPLTTDVPIVGTNQVLVSDVSQFVIAMGCNSYGDGTETFQPMLVRWSDQSNPNVWTPQITNQSGEQRLTNGSYIMQAKRNRQEILIWTDSALYSMQYVGPPYVWGFQLLMDNISIVSPNAAIVVNNVAYWMGNDKFYSYSGVVQTLPCAVRQYIFDDLNYDQRYQVVAGSNERYNEVWWFYVSNTEVAAAAQAGRTPLVDKYVIYNYLENTWYYGTMSRTYWLDSHTQPYPLAAIPLTGVNTGTMLYHEDGTDDASTATVVPFNAFISSSDFDIGDGDRFGFVWRIIPDVNFSSSNAGYPSVNFQFQPKNYPGAPYTKSITDPVNSAQQYTPIINQYTVQQYTQQIWSRIRGRQMNITVSSSGQLGVAWQLGSPRIDIRSDGRR